MLEAWLHGGSDSKHHKALKELSVHNLRQIQREVCGVQNPCLVACGVSHVAIR